MARKPTPYERRVIERAAKRHGITPATLWGVYGAETNFGALKNRSSAGAQGPFQFMPATARAYGINPYNFAQAANAAAKYLATYKKRGIRGALAAYNAGPAGNPNNPETRAYIPKVLRLRQTWPGGTGRLRGGGGGGSSGGGGSADGGGNLYSARIPQTGTVGDIASLLPAIKSPYPTAPLTPPTFAAQATMPQMYTPVQSGQGPSPLRESIEEQIAAAGNLRGPDVPRAQMPDRSTGGAQKGGGALSGAVKGVKPGGGYRGTEGIVKGAMRGIPVSNYKRTPEHNRRVGGAPGSDHLTTRANAYAADFPPKYVATVAKRLGIKGNYRGTYRRHIVRIGGKRYSVQILIGVKGHYDHGHVGVQAI